MELHLFTLRRLAVELNEIARGAKVINCYTRQKNELTITIHPTGRAQIDVVISTDSRNPFLIWREAGKQPRISTRLMESMIGREILDVGILGEERVVKIDFDEESFLAIQLFRNRANVFLIFQNQIESSFKREKQLAGTTFQLAAADLINPFEVNETVLQKEMAANPQMSLGKFLKRKIRYLNPTLVRELLFRLGLEESLVGAELPKNRVLPLLEECRQLIASAERGNPRIYFEDDVPVVFSLLPLLSEQGKRVEEFSSVNEALKKFLFKRQRIFRLTDAKSSLKEKLSGKQQQALHILHQLHQLPDEQVVQNYNRKIGELIFANMGQIGQVEEEIELIDYFDPELRKIKVRLNPNLTLKENAERYLRRAKEITERRKEILERKQELEELLKKIESLLLEVEKAENEKEIKKVGKRLQELKILPTAAERMEEESKPFRTVIHKGWEFWIGKNARGNDELTFRYAHKEDWWLHAQGVAGSHVVIRNPRRQDSLPPEIKEYGAILAAKNSAARHSSYVPVMITRVKYVRKPRGAQPGTAIPERIKTIFVEPAKKNIT